MVPPRKPSFRAVSSLWMLAVKGREQHAVVNEEAAHDVPVLAFADARTFNGRLPLVDERGVPLAALHADALLAVLDHRRLFDDQVGIAFRVAAEGLERGKAFGIVGDGIAAPVLAQTTEPGLHARVLEQRAKRDGLYVVGHSSRSAGSRL